MEYLFRPNRELTYARNEAAERNRFLSQSMNTVPLPTFEESRNLLPQPV